MLVPYDEPLTAEFNALPCMLKSERDAHVPENANVDLLTCSLCSGLRIPKTAHVVAINAIQQKIMKTTKAGRATLGNNRKINA